MTERVQPDLRIDRDLLQLRAVMFSFGKAFDLPTGYFPLRSHGSEYEDAIFDVVTLAADALGGTGSEIVCHERQLAHSGRYYWGQTLSPFLDVQHDQPLFLAAVEANMAGDLTASVRLLEEPGLSSCPPEYAEIGLVLLGGYAPIMRLELGATWSALRADSPCIDWSELLRWLRGIGRLGYQGTEEGSPSGAEAERASEDESDRTQDEAFELMARAEAEQEARTEDEVDESRVAYTLVRDDE